MLEIGSINLDPMVPHLWPHFLAGEIENDEVGFLPGHVAVNAVFGDWMVCFGKGRGVWLVAGEATL